MEVIQRVAQQRLTMREVVVTLRLPLRPVPRVMRSDRPQRSAYSDDGSQPEQDPLDALVTLETAMNESSMESHTILPVNGLAFSLKTREFTLYGPSAAPP